MRGHQIHESQWGAKGDAPNHGPWPILAPCHLDGRPPKACCGESRGPENAKFQLELSKLWKVLLYASLNRAGDADSEISPRRGITRAPRGMCWDVSGVVAEGPLGTAPVL